MYYKLNIFKAIAFILIILIFSTSQGMAQTTINLPQACDCPMAGSHQSSNGTAVVSNYGNSTCTNPSSGTINGTMTQGVAVSGVTMTLYANVTQVGTWSLSAVTNGVTFSGSGTFTALGCQPITLTASGTPTAAGSHTWNTNSTPSGSGTATVAAGTDPSSNGTAVVSNYGNSSCANPSSGTINGTMTQGVAVSGVTMTLYANVTQVGTWSLSAMANGVTFSGSGTFTTLGCQPITLTASGTPTATGSHTWNTNSTPSGSGTATVAAAFNPSGITLGQGSLGGRTCFDIALSNDNTNACAPLSARIANQANFTLSATHTQTYTFTPVGTVSNVRFYYINDVGNAVVAIAGGNAGNNISSAVTATVNYNTNNNALALGLTNSNPMVTRIFAVYNVNPTNNSNPADDRILSLTANVKDCACCVAKISPTEWKEFLCHNLGADITLDPHNMSQTNAWGLQGAYIQWGKRGPNTTGDSRIDWQTAANNGSLGFVAAPTASNSNHLSISSWSQTRAANFSWRTAAGAKTANDPCPLGYRVPTTDEWTGVHNNNTSSTTGTFTNSPTNYGTALHYGPDASTKLLTLPAAGYRLQTNGQYDYRGARGYYWSSTERNTTSSNEARDLVFLNTGVILTNFSDRAYGMPVRCIKE